MSRARQSVSVNGTRYERDVDPRLALVDFLRDELGLTGTHIGCEQGVCGACTVLVDGDVGAVLPDARRPGATAARCRTVEGLAAGADLHPLQEAFWDQQGAAVRLLHAGDADARQGDPGRRTPHPAPRRCARRSRATCAGARATSSSSSRSSTPPNAWPEPEEGREMTAPPAVRRHDKQDDLGRQVDQADRGPEVPARPRAATSPTASMPGMLHTALVRSPLRARPDHEHRSRPGPGRCPAWWRSSPEPKRPSCAIRCPTSGPIPASTPGGCWPTEKVRYVGEGVGGDRGGEPLRRGGRRRSRDRSTTSRCRRSSTRRRRSSLSRRWCTTRSARTSPTSARSTFGDVDGAFADADLVVEDRLQWGRSGAQPLEDSGGDRRLRPRHRAADRLGELPHLHQLPVPVRRHAQDPLEQARRASRSGRRQFRVQALGGQAGGDREHALAGSPDDR